MRDIDCLRCGARMKYMFMENLQLGKTGWILGDLPNLFAGALCADIFVCPDCGKVFEVPINFMESVSDNLSDG